MFKKLFTFVSCCLLTANCLAQSVYNYPTLDDPTTYVGTYAPVAAPMAFATDGTLYTTGLFDKTVLIGDDILDPVATSAYLSAFDVASSSPKWTVGIQGSAHITAVTATSEAVYVAGTFADDITLGSLDFQTKSYSGTPLSHDMVNGFVAKYSFDGYLLASRAILPHKVPGYAEDEYESDLMVYPTSIAAFNGNIFLSMTFLGGYDYDSFSQDGNLKSSFGYWDSKCADVLSLSSSDLSFCECIYDLRNSEDVNTNGYAPTSICLTSTADNLYIGAFTSQNCKETIYGSESQFDEGVSQSAYFFTLHSLDAIGYDNAVTLYAESDRSYINNIVRKMTVADGKLYVAGCVSTPLPMAPSLVPDLWCDQFAACFSADLNVSWAGITGALRDDMQTTDEKYRQTTDACVSQDKFVVIGSTNFQCNAEATLSPFSSDYCLGIADNGTSLALLTKTDAGSQLTVTSHQASDFSLKDISLVVASGEKIDESDGTFKVTLLYTSEGCENHPMAEGTAYYTVTPAGGEADSRDVDFDPSMPQRNIYVKDLAYATEYTLTVDSISVVEFNTETFETDILFTTTENLPSITFTTNSDPSGIDEVNVSAPRTDGKFIEDNQLVIIKNGKKYHTTGISIR